MRAVLGALLLTLIAAHAVAAAEVRNFSGTTAYEGTVRVTPMPSPETEALFMSVDWTFGAYVVRGYGIVAKDDPLLLTVSYVVPLGLGVGRYRIQPDGNVIGTLVGERGIFVEEVWTRLDAPGPSSTDVLKSHQ